jgi:hypothetical protein
MKNIFQLLEKEFILQDPATKVSEGGLYAGKTGCAIIYYLLGRYRGDERLTQKAEDLMEAVFDNIETVGDNFHSGLSGIGWAVEWLARHEFVDLNTDEFLEDIDDTLYKNVLVSPEPSISLEEGTIGKTLFFAIRNESRNPGANRMRKIYMEMCLVILTDELHDRLIEEEGLIASWSDQRATVDDIRNIGQALLFTCEFLPANINTTAVDETLYGVAAFTEELLKRTCEHPAAWDNEKLTELQYLAFCYYALGLKYDNRVWARSGKQYLLTLLAMNIPVNERSFVYYTIMKNCTDNESLLAAIPEIEPSVDPGRVHLLVQEALLSLLIYWKERVLEFSTTKNEL